MRAPKLDLRDASAAWLLPWARRQLTRLRRLVPIGKREYHFPTGEQVAIRWNTLGEWIRIIGEAIGGRVKRGSIGAEYVGDPVTGFFSGGTAVPTRMYYFNGRSSGIAEYDESAVTTSLNNEQFSFDASTFVYLDSGVQVKRRRRAAQGFTDNVLGVGMGVLTNQAVHDAFFEPIQAIGVYGLPWTWMREDGERVVYVGNVARTPIVKGLSAAQKLEEDELPPEDWSLTTSFETLYNGDLPPQIPALYAGLGIPHVLHPVSGGFDVLVDMRGSPTAVDDYYLKIAAIVGSLSGYDTFTDQPAYFVTAPYVTQRDYTVELDEESNPTGTVWVELFINTFQALYIYNYLTNAWDEVWSQDLETHYHALAESSSNPTLPGTSAGYSVGGVPVQAPSTPPVLFTASADVVAGVSSISTQNVLTIASGLNDTTNVVFIRPNVEIAAPTSDGFRFTAPTTPTTIDEERRLIRNGVEIADNIPQRLPLGTGNPATFAYIAAVAKDGYLIRYIQDAGNSFPGLEYGIHWLVRPTGQSEFTRVFVKDAIAAGNETGIGFTADNCFMSPTGRELWVFWDSKAKYYEEGVLIREWDLFDFDVLPDFFPQLCAGWSYTRERTARMLYITQLGEEIEEGTEHRLALVQYNRDEDTFEVLQDYIGEVILPSRGPLEETLPGVETEIFRRWEIVQDEFLPRQA